MTLHQVTGNWLPATASHILSLHEAPIYYFQQPGWPWFPQQLCLMAILRTILLPVSLILVPIGIGLRILIQPWFGGLCLLLSGEHILRFSSPCPRCHPIVNPEEQGRTPPNIDEHKPKTKTSVLFAP